MSDDPGHEPDDWTAAWRRDCERVGLTDTTTDLGEIKRAYARTLRKTRPDDDAQAYQALREAYDRLVGFARAYPEAGAGAVLAAVGKSSDDVSEDVDASSMPASTAPRDLTDTVPPVPEARAEATADTTAGAPDVDTSEPTWVPPRDWRTPEELCDWLIKLRREGQHRLRAAIPELQQALSALPLEVLPQASLSFANLLLDTHAEFPVRLVDLLRTTFDWGDDFRVERLLGFERASALRALLALVPRPVRDQALIHEFGPLAGAARLAGSPRSSDRARALLAAVFMGGAVDLHLRQAGGRTLNGLGANKSDLNALRKLFTLTVPLIHLALLSVVMFGVLWAATGDLSIPTAAVPVLAILLPLFTLVYRHGVAALTRLRAWCGNTALGRWRPAGWPAFWPWSVSRWSPAQAGSDTGPPRPRRCWDGWPC